MRDDDLGEVRIEGTNLRVIKGGKVLLRDVTLKARAGEVLGVLGPSGAGKTTLFRSMTGDGETTSGRVTLAGRDVTAWPLWRRAREGLGYIPQSPSVLLGLTVRENLETFNAIGGGSADASAEANGAERVSLGDRADVRAGELSAGERRRLEVARSLVTHPKVLICDEPFAGVDPAGAGQIASILRELADEGAAVIIADHHVAEALACCDRAVLLLDGAIALEASPEVFRDHPLVQGRYLGTWTRSIPPSP